MFNLLTPFKSLASITFSTLIMLGMTPAFAQTAKEDLKGAKEDVKDAAQHTGKAVKKTGKAVKKTAKKAVNKTAEKTEEGAAAVKRKTNP